MKKNHDQMNAFLGEGTEFEGKLSFRGTVRLDGRFKGEILSEGILIVGKTAVLEAEVRIGRIVVSGEVRGNITAEERIDIHAPAKIYGNIQAPVVSIHEGVVFEGNCRMHKGGEGAHQKLAVLQQ